MSRSTVPVRMRFGERPSTIGFGPSPTIDPTTLTQRQIFLRCDRHCSRVRQVPTGKPSWIWHTPVVGLPGKASAASSSLHNPLRGFCSVGGAADRVTGPDPPTHHLGRPEPSRPLDRTVPPGPSDASPPPQWAQGMVHHVGVTAPSTLFRSARRPGAIAPLTSGAATSRWPRA